MVKFEKNDKILKKKSKNLEKNVKNFEKACFQNFSIICRYFFTTSKLARQNFAQQKTLVPVPEAVAAIGLVQSRASWPRVRRPCTSTSMAAMRRLALATMPLLLFPASSSVLLMATLTATSSHNC